jgi:hypothetical protein
VTETPIEQLIPYARNARTHSDAQVAQLAASIREFNFTNPVLIDGKGNIIAGHGRVLAARQLGMETVPTLTIGQDWSEAKRRAYVLADNKLALNAGWDFDLLRLELQDLDTGEIDLSLTGFSSEELEQMLTCAPPNDGLTDPDEVPELTEDAITQPGDVWLLGRHRLMCGDSTDGECVSALMHGQKANLCLTDPPYGLADTKSDKNNYIEYRDTKENLIGLIANFLPIAMHHAACVVLTPGTTNHRKYPDPDWTMAWFTPAGVGVGPWGFCCWQPVLCYGKDPKLKKGKGSHPDAIVHTESAEDFGHPCTKPIKFWSWLMERTSETGEVIYEPFSGSGTTIIAGEMTGRAIYAMELSPQYVDVAVKRWQAFTGKRATLESSGVEFGG